MITKDNYFENVEIVGVDNLPQELGDIHQVIASATGNGQNWKIIDEDKEFGEAASLAFEKLDELIGNGALSGTDGKDPKPYIKGKKNTDPKRYRYFREEFKFLIRFLDLNGKEQTEDDVLKFIEALQSAIKQKKIRKTSFFANEIMLIQQLMLDTYKSMKSRIHISITRETENKLKECIRVIQSKNDYSENDEKEDVKELPLSGIKTADSILPSTEFVKKKFTTLGFKGKYLDLIGDPAPGFTTLVFGPPKYGKSYLSIDFAGYLARNHGKVLYVSKEELLDATLHKKFEDTKAAHPNLFVTGEMPADLSPYNFVFLDSITRLKLSPEDLIELEKKYPTISFIYISQVRKDGKVRGSNSHPHDVDVVIEIPEKGQAIQFGRFNQGGRLNIFEEESKQPVIEPKAEPVLEGVPKKKISKRRKLDLGDAERNDDKPRRLPDHYKGISLSSDTLKPEDLVKRYMKFLEIVQNTANIVPQVAELKKKIAEHPELLLGILDDDIQPLLDDIAPPGTFFRTHEGDGANFGFWEEDDDLSGKKSDKMEINAVLGIFLHDFTKYVKEPWTVASLLYNDTDKANTIARKVAQKILSDEKAKVTIRSVRFKETDSDNLTHGTAYFNVRLVGEKSELKKIADEDKALYYGWEYRDFPNDKEDILPDDQNPKYLFSLTHSSLLAEIVKGKIDANYYARREMANRGLDKNGKWVGFDTAYKIHKIKKDDLSDVPLGDAA